MPYINAVDGHIITTSLYSCVCDICKQLSGESIDSDLDAIGELIACIADIASCFHC